MSAVLGARYDQHLTYGGQFSPRIHAKYALTQRADLRITAGKGWRVPNYIIDNVSLLASSKQWVAPSEVRPEISWNFGGSIVQEFKIFKRKASITMDAYRTFFVNQLIIDRDVNSSKVVFNNLSSPSISNSFQTELSIKPLKNLEIRLAYKFLDVKALLS